ncbi:hypothetical protein C672_3602 [[Clostridium] bifermentans ATCC 638]|uniref:Uncharacterized protein n=1 Tax=Paraclostridium bifermentans ATCC 638 = DSM 14991 TaxID=1233171 RepID=T4V7Q9_PARBF|nr:hypothetical protein [Paraclostridium bifermentans]EQK39759.1 hypothetical protein C672_3602 [[Clostridium] bifermentans ATCC 638] [Paraclostridium bifermentans ATCC 638 = DSM 14991]RIZ57428.1 hypothetical protein CHH45_16455 [Paraclostridium bifermentans]
MNKVDIIEDNEESIQSFRQMGWGHSDYCIDYKQLEDLKNGKLIAMCDGEYTSTIKLIGE